MPEAVPSLHAPPQDARAAAWFSTEQFSERERIAAWREFIGRMFCKVNIEPHSPERFASSATMRMLPGLGIVSGNCSPLSYVQSPDLIENDDVIVTVSSQPWELQRQGRDIVFHGGDATVTSAADTGTYRLPFGGRHFGVRVPFALMSPLVPKIEDAFGRRIPVDTPALQLLIHYLGGVRSIAGPGTEVLQRRAAAPVHDLLARSRSAPPGRPRTTRGATANGPHGCAPSRTTSPRCSTRRGCRWRHSRRATAARRARSSGCSKPRARRFPNTC